MKGSTFHSLGPATTKKITNSGGSSFGRLIKELVPSTLSMKKVKKASQISSECSVETG